MGDFAIVFMFFQYIACSKYIPSKKHQDICVQNFHADTWDSISAAPSQLAHSKHRIEKKWFGGSELFLRRAHVGDVPKRYLRNLPLPTIYVQDPPLYIIKTLLVANPDIRSLGFSLPAACEGYTSDITSHATKLKDPNRIFYSRALKSFSAGEREPADLR